MGKGNNHGAKELVLSMLSECQEPMTSNQLAGKCGLELQTVSDCMFRLARDGAVEKVSTTRPITYRLVKKEEAEAAPAEDSAEDAERSSALQEEPAPYNVAEHLDLVRDSLRDGAFIANRRKALAEQLADAECDLDDYIDSLNDPGLMLRFNLCSALSDSLAAFDQIHGFAEPPACSGACAN